MATYSGGRYSKFQQRLRNIYINRLKKKKKEKMEQDEFIKDKVEEIKKELSKDKNVSVVKGKKILNRNLKNRYFVEEKMLGEGKGLIKNDGIKKNLSEEKTKINKKNVVSKFFDKKTFVDSKKIFKKKVKVGKDILLQENIDKFGFEIIQKLKLDFLEKCAEVEVLESELFLLSQLNKDTLELEKVKEVKKEINRIIDEINLIIEQYNLYSTRSSLDIFVGFDDKYLEDNIIKYREMLGSYNDEKGFVKEYKLLDEFNSLYFRLNNIKQNVEDLQDENKEKIEEYDIRDKKYDNLVLKLNGVNDLRKGFESEFKKQDEYLKELLKKINDINKEEYVNRRLVGFGEFLFGALRYLGLRMLSPLSGSIPSIVANTMMARNTVRMLRDNVRVERVHHVYYDAINYENELNSKLTDINYTGYLVDKTIDDLKKMKEEFFTIYSSDLPGYDKTLFNINKMEELLYKNQCKVNFIKKNLKESKKLNENKMIKVKEMNENRS